MSKPPNRELIIVGMHRSMTSLVTHWLHTCGLEVGEDLYGAGIGNVMGHFEDYDFIHLHNYILKINESHWRDASGKTLQFDDYSKEKSQMLIKLKSDLHGQWGWKDPRTCLFLDHWNSLLPEGRYLIVYRPFADVVDSLLRREFKVKNRVRYVLDARKYVSKMLHYKKRKEDNLRLCMHYNEAILSFIQRTEKEKFVVLRSDQLLNKSEQVFEVVKENWGFDLEFSPMTSIYNSDITKKAPVASLKGVDPELYEKAGELENKLGEFCLK